MPTTKISMGLALVAALVAWASGPVQAQTVPKNYKELRSAFGDLNGDGKGEKVVVYEVKPEDKKQPAYYELIVYRREPNGPAWTVWLQSQEALIATKEKSFAGMDIKNGQLSLSYTGGDAKQQWGTTETYRYRNEAFELVSFYHAEGNPCQTWTDYEYNTATGEISIKREMENCEGKEQKIQEAVKEKFMQPLGEAIRLEKRRETKLKIVSPEHQFKFEL